MNIRTIALFVCMAFAATLATATAGKLDSIEVVNASDKCAWVTIYGADWATSWSILTAPDWSRPRFIKPGEKHTFTISWHTGYTEVKARAELKETADCKGGTVRDVYDVYKSPSSNHDGGHVRATFGGSGGTYWMKI